MREQVEQYPRLDASLIHWSGLLKRAWRDVDPTGADEPDAWRLLRLDSELTYWPDAAPWATFRVASSAPRPDGVNDAVLLLVEFIADKAAVFGSPGMTWTTQFELVPTLANFGGVRWWFRCTTCSRRRAHLYPFAPGPPWVCRECLGLTYKSRQEQGHSSRHGNGWGSVGHALDRALARLAVRGRRRYRRAYHRARTQASSR